MDVIPTSIDCSSSQETISTPAQRTTIQPEIILLFIFNFLTLLFLVIRVYKAERLISDLLMQRTASQHGLESVQKDVESIKRHKLQKNINVMLQENIYQKVLVHVEAKTKELTGLVEAKERLLTSLAAKYQASFPEFKKAVHGLREEIAQLHVKLESEVSSLHFRLSSFSSPASSEQCLTSSSSGKPETLYVHRTILPEKNVNDEFVHVPGLGLISTEELDQIDCSFIGQKSSGKRKFRFNNPLSWLRRKTRDLKRPEDMVEEDRASFGPRSRM
ncbi:uncharacterized protein LOC129580961 [Paramacrobiotus metropolitanus]|uniref:uncharacterized protein LOC129580961 n=1 Tax=Paramacrobiotus metropolitanus TaxID=2943436 RepID=UPI002446038C|nr:uncharacterized protein LOC129580961 [Paramacrobiotus metropolitanus]